MAKSLYNVLSPIDIGAGRVEPGGEPVEIDDKVARSLVDAGSVEPVAEKAPAPASSKKK